MQTALDMSEFVDAAGDAIVVSDPEGLIVVWNRSAERIFGFAEAEALGQPLDLITPDRHRRRHWDGYHKTMHTGVTRYGTDLLKVPALHKDGHALSIAFTIGLLHGEDGTIKGCAAIIRDETARWNEERRLRKRIADLEAEMQNSASS